MDQHIHHLGEQAALEANLVGLHEKLLDYLGRLHFRTSYSQNVLRHSLEVAFLTGLLADEIGLIGALGRRCGLLHDIGKAADHEMEGGHPAVGAELLRRYGEPKEVIHAALGHHDDLRVETPYTLAGRRRPMPSAPAAPVRGEKRSRNTFGGSRSSKLLPSGFREWSRRMLSRRAAKCGSLVDSQAAR